MISAKELCDIFDSDQARDIITSIRKNQGSFYAGLKYFKLRPGTQKLLEELGYSVTIEETKRTENYSVREDKKILGIKCSIWVNKSREVVDRTLTISACCGDE